MESKPKSFKQKLFKEIKVVAVTTLYFAIWFGVLMFLKVMILGEYKIEFSGVTKALVAALILGKVVLIIDHIPLSRWTREHSAIWFILFRTLFNIVGVFIVLLLEKAFHARHEFDGFGSALMHVFQQRDFYHVWSGITVVSISVFWFNVLYVLRQHLGLQNLSRLFFSIPMNDLESKHNE